MTVNWSTCRLHVRRLLRLVIGSVDLLSRHGATIIVQYDMTYFNIIYVLQLVSVTNSKLVNVGKLVIIYSRTLKWTNLRQVDISVNLSRPSMQNVGAL